MLLGLWWRSENWLPYWWNLDWHLEIPNQTGCLTNGERKKSVDDGIFTASDTALQTMESVHGEHCPFGNWKVFFESTRYWSNLLEIGFVCVEWGSSTYVWMYNHISNSLNYACVGKSDLLHLQCVRIRYQQFTHHVLNFFTWMIRGYLM